MRPAFWRWHLSMKPRLWQQAVSKSTCNMFFASRAVEVLVRYKILSQLHVPERPVLTPAALFDGLVFGHRLRGHCWLCPFSSNKSLSPLTFLRDDAAKCSCTCGVSRSGAFSSTFWTFAFRRSKDLVRATCCLYPSLQGGAHGCHVATGCFPPGLPLPPWAALD